MKKCLLGLLLVVAIIAVSCSQDNAVQDELISISFAKLEAKAIESAEDNGTTVTATVKIGEVADYYWSYKATKADEGFSTGATEGFVSCGDAAGLGGARNFSKGKWTFELKAYATSEARTAGTSAIFEGKVTTESLTNATNTVNIPINYTYVSGTGTAKFEITANLDTSTTGDEGNGYAISAIKMTIGTTEVSLTKDSTDETKWTATKDSVTSGAHAVGITVTVSKTSADDETATKADLCTAVIMHGMTTEITGTASVKLTLQDEQISITFNPTTPTTQPTLAVGETALGGGYIFYDVDADNNDGTEGGKGADGLTSADCGWRYIQAATSDITTNANKKAWGPSLLLSTATTIGSGYANTKKIYDATTDKTTDNMATAVWNKTIDGGTGWFIPSFRELKALYAVLKAGKNLSSLGNGVHYWSSSDTSETMSRTIVFESGNEGIKSKSNGCMVRPVRYLTESGEVYIPTETQAGK
jgi:hypothetical protein